MVTITTKSGFKCKIDENRCKDWSYVRALALCETGNEKDAIIGLTTAIPILLGKDEERLVKHLTKDGICNTADVVREFKEIVQLLGATTKK